MPSETLGKIDGHQASAVQQADLATVERLSTAFNACFDRLDADDDMFSADVFFDLYPPMWRYQLRGKDAFIAQLRAVTEGATRTRILRVIPTTTGFVMEHEQVEWGAKSGLARALWLCEVRDERITEAVGYCNGHWDDELRARHASEAPMLRP
jgi:hypothetical protein